MSRTAVTGLIRGASARNLQCARLMASEIETYDLNINDTLFFRGDPLYFGDVTLAVDSTQPTNYDLKTFATIQEAVDAAAQSTTATSITINVSQGDYAENLVVAGIRRSAPSFIIAGDTRTLAACSWVHGMDIPDVTNAGTGTATLSGYGTTTLTVTGSLTDPDFVAAGVVSGDRVRIAGDTGNDVAEYQVITATTNTLTMTTTILASTVSLGAAVTILPNRRITGNGITPPATATIELTNGVTLRGFDVNGSVTGTALAVQDAGFAAINHFSSALGTVLVRRSSRLLANVDFDGASYSETCVSFWGDPGDDTVATVRVESDASLLYGHFVCVGGGLLIQHLSRMLHLPGGPAAIVSRPTATQASLVITDSDADLYVQIEASGSNALYLDRCRVFIENTFLANATHAVHAHNGSILSVGNSVEFSNVSESIFHLTHSICNVNDDYTVSITGPTFPATFADLHGSVFRAGDLTFTVATGGVGFNGYNNSSLHINDVTMSNAAEDALSFCTLDATNFHAASVTANATSGVTYDLNNGSTLFAPGGVHTTTAANEFTTYVIRAQYSSTVVAPTSDISANTGATVQIFVRQYSIVNIQGINSNGNLQGGVANVNQSSVYQKLETNGVPSYVVLGCSVSDDPIV